MNTSELVNRLSGNIIAIIVLVLTIFCIYGNTLNHHYNMDDQYVVEDNEQVKKGLKGLPEIFSSYYIIYNEKGLDYRPIVKASFALEYQLFKENPEVSHLINLILFVISIVLLFYCLRNSELGIAVSLMICLVYLAHPFSSEVVCSLKNRDHLFSFIFCLGAYLYAIKYVKMEQYKYIIICVMFFLLSLMSKISAAPFGALIPLVIYSVNEFKINKRIVEISIALCFMVILFYSFTHFVMDAYARPNQFIENPIPYEDNILSRVSMFLESNFFYIENLIYPQNLICYYGYDALNILETWKPKTFLALVTALLAIVGFVYCFFKKNKLFIPLALLLINLFLVSNLVAFVPGIVADRIAFGGILLSWALVVVLAGFKVLGNRLVYLYLFVLLGLYIPKTIERNADWKDRITLFGKDANKNRKSAKVQYLYAEQLLFKYIREGKTDKQLLDNAKQAFFEAITIFPDYPSANNKYGVILARYENNPEKGIEYLLKAVQSNPNFEDALFNLAASYHQVGNIVKAKLYYQKVINLNPNRTKAVENLRSLN